MSANESFSMDYEICVVCKSRITAGLVFDRRSIICWMCDEKLKEEKQHELPKED